MDIPGAHPVNYIGARGFGAMWESVEAAATSGVDRCLAWRREALFITYAITLRHSCMNSGTARDKRFLTRENAAARKMLRYLPSKIMENSNTALKYLPRRETGRRHA